jgi:hypothetical protein
MFYYDQEEFWFHDGRLLLRGNNGTGKSKVLALTLPFLLDGELAPYRVEPDGDRQKRSARSYTCCPPAGSRSPGRSCGRNSASTGSSTTGRLTTGGRWTRTCSASASTVTRPWSTC